MKECGSEGGKEEGQCQAVAIKSLQNTHTFLGSLNTVHISTCIEASAENPYLRSQG